MANPEHVKIVKQGKKAIDAWRIAHPGERLDLREADLNNANLNNANLNNANLRGTDLREADLREANLFQANLRRISGLIKINNIATIGDLWGADLTGANLSEADLRGVRLNQTDLSQANISEANLGGVTLNKADLSEVTLNQTDLSQANLSELNLSRLNISGSNLSGANLDKVNLNNANLSGANLRRANLSGANLRKANLSGANLRKANLSGADLRRANLSGAILSGAILSGVDLSGFDLSGFDLCEANLSSANLSQANLIAANFDGATITNACLWETQRARWSIKDIICEAVCWDDERKKLTRYEPDEFERLYADTFKIKLRYEGGINLVEITTLPALIKQIEDKHPGCVLRFQSIQDDAGGASVTIAVDNLGGYNLKALETTAQQTQNELRLALKESEHLRIKLDVVMKEVIPNIVRECMTQINVSGNVQGNLVGGNVQGNLLGTASNSDVQMTYTPHELADIRSLINNIFDQRQQIGLAPEKLTELETAVQKVQKQLADQMPNHSIIKETGKTIRNILEGAVGSTLASGWLPMLQKLLG